MSPIFEYNFITMKKIKTGGNLHKIIQKEFYKKISKLLRNNI